MSEFAIGVDLGGTNLRAAAATADGALLEEFSIPTEASAGPDAIVEKMAAGIEEVREGHSGDELIGVGVGVPGLVRMEEGVIAEAPNLPGWHEYPLRDRLEARLGRRVIVENDANAAALGEVWLGAGHDVEDLVLLTLGTGVGGGIISEGHIVHGVDGMAGEIGHITVDPNSPWQCGCGNYGCLESDASGTGIVRKAEAAIREGRSELLAALTQSEGGLTPLLLARAAGEGDAAAKRIFEEMGRSLGRGLASLINVFNFPLYLIAGGVLASWDLFAPALFEEVEIRSVTYRNTETRIERARLGAKAGIFGAARLPFQAQAGRQDKL